MSSEIIVVVVLSIVAIAFVIWIRVNSQTHSPVVKDSEPEGPGATYDARMTKPDQVTVRPRSKQK